MNHADHVNLIRDGVAGSGNIWADFGSGSGAFTLALADVLGPAAEIYTVDRNSRALREQAESMRRTFPATRLHPIEGDFTRPLGLPELDGIVVANALHFVRDQGPVMELILAALKPGGRLVVVEYNTDRGNHWVPYPFSVATFVGMAQRAGFVETRRLASRPSRFLGEIFSAVTHRAPE